MHRLNVVTHVCVWNVFVLFRLYVYIICILRQRNAYYTLCMIGPWLIVRYNVHVSHLMTCICVHDEA